MARPGSEPPIRFGSGGWRGVLGDAFTFERARALAGAAAAWARAEHPGAPLLVAHDTRFLADRAADEVAAAIASAGVPVLRAGPSDARRVGRRCGRARRPDRDREP
jgi:phosphomannomutase